jgi:hypothetical protein
MNIRESFREIVRKLFQSVPKAYLNIVVEFIWFVLILCVQRYIKRNMKGESVAVAANVAADAASNAASNSGIRKTSKAVRFADSVTFAKGNSVADSLADSDSFAVADSLADSLGDESRRGFNLTPYDIDIIVGGTQSVLMLCVMYYLYIQSDEIVPRKQKKPEETTKK